MASSCSNIADCILSNEPLMQIEGGNANIFGSLEVKNGFWAWSDSGRAENWTCHQNQRMEPADKGDEILPINHPQFLSDRNFISFPGYCKTCMRKWCFNLKLQPLSFIQQRIWNFSFPQSEIPTLDIPLLTSKPDAISFLIWTIYMTLKSGIKSD